MADLTVVPSREKQRHESLIEKLTIVLEQAKRGEIESVLAVCMRPGTRGQFFTFNSGVKDGLVVIGCLETLKHDLMNDMDAEASRRPDIPEPD